MGRAHRDTEGAAVIEFALVAPVLLLLLVGILDLGRAVNAYVTVSNAAREGTHYAALHPTAAPAAIASAVRARVAPLDPASVQVTASYYDGSTFRSWPASGGVPASSPPAYVPVRVSICFPWSAATFIGQFFPATSPAPCGGGATAYFVSSSTVDMLR
jgi:Flp pilus assembly pilin Flp